MEDFVKIFKSPQGDVYQVCQGTGTWHEQAKRLGEDIFFPGRLAFRAMLSKNAIF